MITKDFIPVLIGALIGFALFSVLVLTGFI